MNPIHLLGLSLLVTLAACIDQQKEPASTGAPAVTTSPAAPTTAVTSAPVDVQAPAASTGTVADPNPPHGQPGHRCEIPVGASLSSTAAAPATPVGQQTTMPQMSAQPAAAAGSTPPGINPPHGEPGHDCAVPVGSPLPAK